MTSQIYEVVQIACPVLTLWFLVIDYPVLVVDDILVEVLSLDQVHIDEPLVGDVVELHAVALLPIVE